MTRWKPKPDRMCFFEGVECVADTEKALLCRLEDGTKFWVPRSQVNEDCEIEGQGDIGVLIIPEWIAREKEILNCANDIS